VIGCIILARHPAPSTRNPARVNPACVVELVYMGIVPEHRGRDYGQAVMAVVTEVCQQQGAERLILAVDETNAPAIAAYRRFDMLHMFRETVWGRSVGAAENHILA
jgi:ribosomal protein S18 acetylase RimI-like enzyme